MSQAGIVNATGVPLLPTNFAENTGAATPAGNVLNIVGTSGISTSGAGNTITVTTNNPSVVSNVVITSDATITPIITAAMGGTPGIYTLKGIVTAFDSTDTAGAGYFFTASLRTTGAAGTLIGFTIVSTYEEAAMIPATIAVVASANNIVLQVTGIAATTIDWKGEFEYQFVG